MLELALVVAAPVALGVVFAGVIRWRFAFNCLLLYLPFAGMFVLWSGHHWGALLAKDFLFVIPIYLSLFLFHGRELRGATIPGGVTAAVLCLAVLVILQALNPEIANVAVAAIGAKVWLFYIPLAYVAAAAIRDEGDLVRLLRLIVAIAIVPCAVGLFQWFLTLTIGYENAITLFYGAEAEAATQGFAKFRLGGWFYRIPSTFSFVAGYAGFTLAMLPPTYALIRLDPSPAWRRFGRLVFVLVMVAGFLTGSRGNLLFVPLLVTLLFVMDRRITGAMGAMVAVPILLVVALHIGGVDPLKALGVTQDLTSKYTEEIVLGGPLEALQEHPFGMGTGMNTGAARYAAPDQSFYAIESYYAKAAAELSILGLVALIAVFASLVGLGYGQLRRIRDPRVRSVGAAMVAFLVFMALHSGKGWQLDVDPINVYFWVFAGVLFKLPHLHVREIRHAGNSTRWPTVRRRPLRGRVPQRS